LDCLKIPVVNYYFDILAEAIKEIDKKSIQLKNSTFKTIISHDIDECTTGWLYNSFWYLKDFKILKSFQMIFQKIFRNDIWFNFDKIIEVEKKHEIKSSYFFIPTNKKYGKIKNSDYKFHSKPMQDAVNKLESNGHEIAIHGSYGTGFINGMMEEELSQFGRETKGGRFHYLAIKIPDSFDIIEKSGIKYDSSLGFAQSVGFRTGYCYPYFPYDITNNRKYTFLEFPLSIMDITLENKQYMNCKLNNATNIINPIINEVEKFGGVLTILWHNKFFSGYKYGWGQTFEVVVEYCKSKHTQFHLFKNFIK